MKDFFISYNSADKRWAEWIAWQLEEEGYTTILQAWDFGAGSNFVVDMQNASAGAERTIAVLSPSYLKSGFTMAEWAVAFARDPTGEKGLLLPVRVEECEPKGLLPQIVYIDLVGLDDEVAKEALLKGVKRERPKPPKAPPFPTEIKRSVAEQPRFPGSLPPIYDVPHLRNPNFTGREDLLESLRTALTSGKHAALTQQAIAGMGGVGKTQLAIEYSYRYMADYDLIWWVRSEEPATLASDYARLAQPLDLPQKDATEQPVIVEAVRNWLGRNGGWLLIFDNASAPDELRDYHPQAPTGQLIITSRNPNWGNVAGSLQVNVWPRKESVAFLLKRTGQSDEEAADKLAQELGDLPLALEQAAAYIMGTGGAMSGYLKLFSSRRKELWEKEQGPVGHKQTVETTFSMAMGKVREESPAAADLLDLCAFLAPDEIPKELLTEGKEHLPKRLAKAVADPLKFDLAVVSLRRYSLIQADEDSLTVHRLVQAVARDQLTTNARKKWAEAAVGVLNGAFPYDSDDVRTWPDCAALLPHALAAAGHAQSFEEAPHETARLLSHAGSYLRGRAGFQRARQLYEQALAVAEGAYGGDHADVGAIVNNLGGVLKDLGDLQGAKAHFERALKIGEDTGGPDHPNVAIRVNNLGLVLRALGDLEGAKRHFERALRIGERTLGPDHPTVAIRVNNLGLVLKDLGDLEGAKAHFQRALKIGEDTVGPDHPSVAAVVNNLGSVLKDLRDLEGAKRHFERALKIDEAAFGPDHPKVARDVNNLGGVLKDLGDLEGAKAHFERALKIDEAAFGPDHPEVATDVNNLGLVLKAVGDLHGAKAHFERALKIDEAAFGPDHPQVATDVNNLGLVLKELGDLEGAKVHFERALNIFRQFLGDNHSKTVLVRKNLESLGDQPE